MDMLDTDRNTDRQIQMTNTDVETIYWTCQPAVWWKRWTEEGKGFSPSPGLFWQHDDKCQDNVSVIVLWTGQS